MYDLSDRVLRRPLARRQQLVRARTRSKDEIHAAPQRRLAGRPPCSDLFGVKGRSSRASLELAVKERESVNAGIRHIEFLDWEIRDVKRLIAEQALEWLEVCPLTLIGRTRRGALILEVARPLWLAAETRQRWRESAASRRRVVERPGSDAQSCTRGGRVGEACPRLLANGHLGNARREGDRGRDFAPDGRDPLDISTFLRAAQRTTTLALPTGGSVGGHRAQALASRP